MTIAEMFVKSPEKCSVDDDDSDHASSSGFNGLNHSMIILIMTRYVFDPPIHNS